MSVLTATKTIEKKEVFEIKPAKYKDMDKVAEFIRSSADWYEKFVAKKDLDEHYVGRKWIDKNYEMRDFYLGYENDKPVGTISLQFFGDYVYVGYLYLDVSQVGKGYGKKLLDFAMNKVNTLNKKGIILIAHPEAVWATKAYVKYGFEVIASKNEDVCSWNEGLLASYHEDGFELYLCKSKSI